MPEGRGAMVIIRWIVLNKSKIIKSVNCIHVFKIGKSKLKAAVLRCLQSVFVAVTVR